MSGAFLIALKDAVVSDDLSGVQRLLAADAGAADEDAIREYGMTCPSRAAVWAADCGHVAMLEWLLDHGGAILEAMHSPSGTKCCT
jgi:hypothetical protein